LIPVRHPFQDPNRLNIGAEMPVANETSAIPAPPPPAAHEGRPANPWNKAQLEELGKSERLCLLAMSETFKALFAANEFPAARLTALHEKIKTARKPDRNHRPKQHRRRRGDPRRSPGGTTPD
jgi:hypothetical protein